MGTRITLNGLTKSFGATVAVDRVDLAIESGSLFFLLGPSGCGKTTLLRMIAGFIEPNAGTIRFDDRDVTSVAPNKRNTGMVFQSYALWPHMTVVDNVAYGLGVRKVGRRERRQQAMAALEAVQMSAYAQRKPNALSGGQQQRVALARALVIKPSVLLLDEPLSNLDAKLRLEMRSEIKRLCASTGITTVYVTHDQAEALSMADAIAVLRDGRTEQVGPPRELYDRPRSRFVADFLGETNFLDATIKTIGDDGALTLETAAGRLVTAPTSANGVASSFKAGQRVTCSLRPESLRVLDAPSTTNRLTGTRIESMYLGHVAQHVIAVTGDLRLRALELNPSHLGAAGDTMHLRIEPADIVVIDERPT